MAKRRQGAASLFHTDCDWRQRRLHREVLLCVREIAMPANPLGIDESATRGSGICGFRKRYFLCRRRKHSRDAIGLAPIWVRPGSKEAWQAGKILCGISAGAI